MIIVNLMGGLGNQMFQYACGLALASATDEEVCYSTDIFNQQSTFNGYELDKVFGLALPIATHADLKHVLGNIGATPFLRRATMKYQPLELLFPGNVVFERNFAFEPTLAMKLSDGGYLHGYWQSEKYFSNVSDEVRKFFKFQRNDATRLEGTGPINVSIHVRRGDYQNVGSIHATCNNTYYQRALDALALPLQETVLHVFSDDPNWAKREMPKLHPNCRFIEGNLGTDSYKDMYLMSMCDHHVIANSSFSWWGAWLNQSPQKQVIAPKKWFVDPRLSSINITPETWTLV